MDIEVESMSFLWWRREPWRDVQRKIGRVRALEKAEKKSRAYREIARRCGRIAKR